MKNAKQAFGAIGRLCVTTLPFAICKGCGPAVRVGEDPCGLRVRWLRTCAHIGNHFALSWIARNRDRTASVRVAIWKANGKSFDATRTVATSKQMFANWADIPSVIEAPSGDLYAHWLDRISSKTYAYGIRIVRSTDRGKTWKPMGWLHNDVPARQNTASSPSRPRANTSAPFGSDGRAMANQGGKVMLRTAILDGDKIKDERVYSTMMSAPVAPPPPPRSPPARWSFTATAPPRKSATSPSPARSTRPAGPRPPSSTPTTGFSPAALSTAPA